MAKKSATSKELKDSPKSKGSSKKSSKKGAKVKAKAQEQSTLEKVVGMLNGARNGVLNHTVKLNRGSITQVHPHISTTNTVFDYLIGGSFNIHGVNECPGIPRGVITNIYGAEHSGKTSFSLHCAAEVCARGGSVFYVDYENVLDVRYAHKLGVPVYNDKRFCLYQPETLEQGVSAVMAAASQGVDLIVLDSVGAAIPKSQFELSLEEIANGDTGALGRIAAAWSRYTPAMVHWLKHSGSALIAVAQVRSAVNSKVPSVQGGNSWKFYSALRIELKYIGTIQGKRYDPLTHKNVSDAKLGSIIRAKIAKNKICGTTFWEADLECLPNYGFDPLRAVINVAISQGVIAKGGSWYTWCPQNGEEIRCQGMTKFVSLVRQYPNALEELNSMVRPVMGSQNPDVPEDDEEDQQEAPDGEPKIPTLDDLADIAEGKEPGGEE